MRWPRPTIRLRLTLFYGALFLVAGTVLLGITYELVAHSGALSPRQAVIATRAPGDQVAMPVGLPKLPLPANLATEAIQGSAYPSGKVVQWQDFAGKVNASFRQLTAAQAKQLQLFARQARGALRNQQSAQLGALLTRSGIALGIMAVLSIGLGWLMAGRTLRPLRMMTSRARGISESNLHERLALHGPDDELKELADTFDELLGRLEAAFESQRRFVANASHELRTPVTLERTLVEVALADPRSSVESLRDTCRRVLAATEQQEGLIDALLTLARSQRGLESRQRCDLAEVAAGVLHDVHPGGVRVETDLEPAPVEGDHALLGRLVANLVENALHYNLAAEGWVRIATEVDTPGPALTVTNSGPVIASDQIAGLMEPFRRLGADRTETRGSGLGLSIVAAIAAAHGAQMTVAPGAAGGLEVSVRFSAAAEPAEALPSSHGVAQHA